MKTDSDENVILESAQSRLLHARRLLDALPDLGTSPMPLADLLTRFRRPDGPIGVPVAKDASKGPPRPSSLSWMPAHFRDLDMTGPELSRMVTGGQLRVDAARKAFDAAQHKTGRARRGHVVLVGPAGAGKTAIACAWLRSRILVGVERAWFVPAIRIGENRVGANGVRPWAEYAERADALVLDDLGAELCGAPAGGGVAAQRIEAISEVIIQRHHSGRSHVVTTPHSEAVLAKIYGEVIARRIYQGAAVVELGKGGA